MSSFDSERSPTEESDECPTQTTLFIAEKIAFVLMKLIKEHMTQTSYYKTVRRQAKMIFSALEIPEINLIDYLSRIIIYSNAEESTLVNALIYIDRLCEKNFIKITEYNVHRLLFTSIIISIKYNEDQYYEMDYYAKIGGIKVKEMNKLETDFLTISDFRMYINDEDYQKYYDYVMNINEMTAKTISSSDISENSTTTNITTVTTTNTIDSAIDASSKDVYNKTDCHKDEDTERNYS